MFISKREKRNNRKNSKFECNARNILELNSSIWATIQHSKRAFPVPEKYKYKWYTWHRITLSFSKSFSQSATSSWHGHQQEIFAGCTLSISFLGWYEHHTRILNASQGPLKFITNNTALPLLSFHGWPKSYALYSFWKPNSTFSVHNCSDLGWTRVQSWQIMLYCYCQG